ncbi:MAG: hypothetical protein ACLTSZ_08840 [Lachnospiraceae bacterium]
MRGGGTKRAELEGAPACTRLGNAVTGERSQARGRHLPAAFSAGRAVRRQSRWFLTVDLRKELKTRNRSILSGLLQEEADEGAGGHRQAMLFLNRRGYSGCVSCRSCGEVMRCPHCDVSLSLHRGGRLVCHYCGYETLTVRTCPKCGSPFIGGFRAGTQQIEEIVKKAFPQARILRMDADTTRGRTDMRRFCGHSESMRPIFTVRYADDCKGT